MTPADEDAPSASPPRVPRIFCTGIAVIDDIFRVSGFPERDTKLRADDFVSVVGGGAANAAIAIQRLGGMAAFAGPLGGPAGRDPIGDRILATLAAEGIDCSGCWRVDGVTSPVSAVLIDARGSRSIVHHRARALIDAAGPVAERLLDGCDAIMADDHYPAFAGPICTAARTRGLPVVLDIEKTTGPGAPLYAAGTHRLFSRSGLSATLGLSPAATHEDLATSLAVLAGHDDGFLAVTDGAAPILWRQGPHAGQVPAFAVDVVDTLAAGDIFHGAFALALMELGDSVRALRFAAATAALKCMRFGGGAVTPRRAEVEQFLQAQGG